MSQQQDGRNQTGTYQDPHYYAARNNEGPYYSKPDVQYTNEGTHSGGARDGSGMNDVQPLSGSEAAWSQTDPRLSDWSNPMVDANPFHGARDPRVPYPPPLAPEHPASDFGRNPRESYNIPPAEVSSPGSITMFGNPSYSGWNIGHVQSPAIQPEAMVADESGRARNACIPVTQAYANSSSPAHGYMQDLPSEGDQFDSDSVCSCDYCGVEFHGTYGRGNLKRHVKTCSRNGQTVAMVRCPVLGCGKEFKRSDAVRVHTRRSHSGQPFQGTRQDE